MYNILVNKYINVRNIYKNIYNKVIWLEKNDNKYSNKCLIRLLNCFPSVLTFKILKFFEINYLYKNDNIYYHYPSFQNKIKFGKPILKISLNNKNEIIDFTDNCLGFDNSTPLKLILNENYNLLNENYNLVIEYFENDITTKTFKLSEKLDTSIYKLLEE